jgi:lipopolysaccharide export system permease protein
MSRAFFYLARELAKSYVLIGLALLVLFDLLAFLTESEDIGDGRYGVLDALLVVAYRTPVLLVDLSPFIALLGTLNAYASLSATSELIALRVAGVSGMRLGAIAAAVAGGFMAVVGAIELTARPLHLEASLLRMHQTAPAGNPLRGSGFWIRTGRTIVNVATLKDARRPGGIRVFDFSDDGRLEQYRRAASADIVTAQDWTLNDVWRKTYGADGAPAAPETLVTAHWQPSWDPSTRLYDLPIASFSLFELSRRVAGANEPTGARAEKSEFWRRITLPLGGIAYALLAAPFALLSNIRGGRATRLALGTALAFLIYIGEQVVSNAGILAGLPIAVTAAVSPLLVLIIAVALMRRLD